MFNILYLYFLEKSAISQFKPSSLIQTGLINIQTFQTFYSNFFVVILTEKKNWNF